LFAHAGTHIDTPWHFNDSGRKIMDFSIDDFVFSSVLVVDAPSGPWEPIPLSGLEPLEEQVHGSDAVLIRTGFGSYRTSDPLTYVDATPGLSVEAARYLTRFPGLRCVGIDCISIENVRQGREAGFPVHHALLDRSEPLLLLEDANLAILRDRAVSRLWLLPLRMKDLEASPVTAVAEIGMEEPGARAKRERQ
jgi:kynurenine formamidase